MSHFLETGLTPAILDQLSRLGLTNPTPIQEQAIPVALTGKDVMGIAQTGTGKTLAFGLPLIELLLKQSGKAVILVPTRELALQVEESLRRITRHMQPSLRMTCIIGGMPMHRQVQDLRQHPRFIIATPGRLLDHIMQKTVQLQDTVALVLDEADRMLDMGFAPQLNKILEVVPSQRQTMLFSATMAPEVASIAARYMTNPVRIEVARAGTSASQIEQELCYVSHDNKPELLQTYLTKHNGPVLVFSRTKHGAGKLARKLRDSGHSATEIHSNRSLNQRRQALDGFKNGRYRVLVATDVAARGIDVHDIEMVINYDLPDAAEDYVHRIGRTGRAGKSGKAVSFASHDQFREVKSIERVINKPLPLSEHSDAQPKPTLVFSSNKNRSRGSFARRSFGSRPKSSFRR